MRGDTTLASGTAAELSDHETHESAAGRAEPAHSLGRIRLGLLLLAIGLALMKDDRSIEDIKNVVDASTRRFSLLQQAAIALGKLGDKTVAEAGGKPAGEPNAMAFLYREPTLGEAGADPEDGSVLVEDIPAVKVVSIGLRGSYGKKTFLRGYEKLTAWLTAHPEWQAAGSPRTLGYNSPMVPGFMKFSEVQIPITPAAQQQ